MYTHTKNILLYPITVTSRLLVEPARTQGFAYSISCTWNFLVPDSHMIFSYLSAYLTPSLSPFLLYSYSIYYNVRLYILSVICLLLVFPHYNVSTIGESILCLNGSQLLPQNVSQCKTQFQHGIFECGMLKYRDKQKNDSAYWALQFQSLFFKSKAY